MDNKVLILGSSPTAMGGITNVILAHARGKQWDDYHCKWLATNSGGGYLLKLFCFLKAFSLYCIIIYKYKLIHIHTSEPSSLVRKTPFFLIARLLRKKIIIHFHSFSIDTTINSRYRCLYHYIFSHSDKVIVLSQYWKNSICNSLYNGKNVCVVYNPCRKVELETTTKEKWILYAGILNERKGYNNLIHAFSLIADKYPDWKLVFAGNGEIKSGQKLCEELDIANQVVFLGWITGKEKDQYFRKSSIFCLPSYAEGFPMSVLDAWSYALPVITTPVGGIPDIAEDRKNCLLFQPGDEKALACCIDELISNNSLRKNIVENSYRLSKMMLSEEIINSEIGRLYSEILHA